MKKPMSTYETLRDRVRALQASGELPTSSTPEQRADWAYGNAVIENDKVTREMAERAVQQRLKSE